jgi:metal-responsive CopG/Arc/MetJ family transcriptional regulator
MNVITRKNTGVILHSDVIAMVDAVAAEQFRSRSFIINHMLREYLCIMRQKGLTKVTPTAVQPSEPERKEISF